eukprot:351904-Chlamydomonas_euryale.AAC.1
MCERASASAASAAATSRSPDDGSADSSRASASRASAATPDASLRAPAAAAAAPPPLLSCVDTSADTAGKEHRSTGIDGTGAVRPARPDRRLARMPMNSSLLSLLSRAAASAAAAAAEAAAECGPTGYCCRTAHAHADDLITAAAAVDADAARAAGRSGIGRATSSIPAGGMPPCGDACRGRPRRPWPHRRHPRPAHHVRRQRKGRAKQLALSGRSAYPQDKAVAPERACVKVGKPRRDVRSAGRAPVAAPSVVAVPATRAAPVVTEAG